MKSRHWLIAAIGGGACVVSFFLTLWLMEPVRDPKTVGPAALAGASISDEATLTLAAKAAGLSLSDDIKGHAATITRTSAWEATLTGWVADINGDGSPLSIFAYVNGRAEPVIMTRDANNDVADILKLPRTAAA